MLVEEDIMSEVDEQEEQDPQDALPAQHLQAPAEGPIDILDTESGEQLGLTVREGSTW
jgi:hypothetical protein